MRVILHRWICINTNINNFIIIDMISFYRNRYEELNIIYMNAEYIQWINEWIVSLAVRRRILRALLRPGGYELYTQTHHIPHRHVILHAGNQTRTGTEVGGGSLRVICWVNRTRNIRLEINLDFVGNQFGYKYPSVDYAEDIQRNLWII